MGQKLYGTDGIGGLDAQTAPHLLNDSALQVAQNVDYSEHGAAKNASGDSALVETEGTITGLGTASVGGVVYHFYKLNNIWDRVYARRPSDGSSVVVGGTSFTGWSTSGQLRVEQGDDVAILYDGTGQRFWDGSCLYGFGAPEATDTAGLINEDRVVASDAVEKSISNVTISSGVVTVTAVGHGQATGDKCWIDSVLGTTEVNDQLYTITRVDSDNFTLNDVDGSTWSAYSSGGTVYIGACGFSGSYVFRVSNVVELPSGKIIEGSAVVATHRVGDNWGEAVDSLTVTPTTSLAYAVVGYTAANVSDWIDGTYTVGTDLKVSRRIYRNKSGDTAQGYLAAELDHADIYTAAYHYVSGYDQTADANLGAVWLPPSFDAHDAPGLFECTATHAQRLYGSIGNKVYFSGLDGHNYFQPLDYLEMDYPVTALASVGGYLAIFANNGGWLYDPFNVAMKSMNIRLGVSGQDAVESFNGDTWFVNNIGLFRLSALQFGGFSVDAMQATPESGPVDDLWVSAGDGDWSMASTHDTLYMTCSKSATSSTFVLHAGDGFKWSTRDSGNVIRLPMVSDRVNNIVLYPDNAGNVNQVGAGSGLTMTLKSKLYKMLWSQCVELKADMGSGASFAFTVESNEGETSTVGLAGGTGRTIDYAPISRAQGQLMDVQVVGTGTLYGWVLRVDEGAGYAGTKTF